MQFFDPIEAAVREGQAAGQRGGIQKLLIQGRMIERQDVVHTPLPLQYLAQLADDSRRVPLAQFRLNQLNPRKIG